jgi:hypothetical protein
LSSFVELVALLSSNKPCQANIQVNQQRVRNLLFLIIPLYYVLQLFTLDRFPLPSFEEAQMMAAAKYVAKVGVENLFEPFFLESHKLTLFKSPLPVLANAVIIEYSGASMFNFRILSHVASLFLMLLMFGSFARMERGSFKNATVLMSLAFLLDPIFMAKPGFAGNETWALLFLLLSLSQEFQKDPHTFGSTIASALAFALAAYCSVYVLVFLPVLLLYKIYAILSETKENQGSAAFHLLTWPILVGILYLPWILSMGHDAWETWQNMRLGKMQIVPPIPVAEMLLVLGTVFLFLRFWLVSSTALNFPKIILLSVLMILAVHLCAVYVDFPLAYALPFYYLLAFGLLPVNKTNSDARKERYYPLAVICAVHVIVFLLVTGFTISNYQNRKGTELVEMVHRFVPSIGEIKTDDRLYRGVIPISQTIVPIANETKWRACLNAHNFEYLILSQDFKSALKDTSLLDFQAEHLQKLAAISYPSNSFAPFIYQLGLTARNEEHLYACTLYKFKP